MLTNNKKSYFVKGIAMLMAMLMVLSVCLTGCGKKADEAIQKAEAAQGTADEAKSAADAVKALLADYLKTADAVTIAAVNAEIDKALAPYATTEALAAYVKSDKFDELVATLEGYVTKAALEETLKGYVTDAEQAALEKKLTDLINANKGNIDKALNDLKAVATDAEVDAIKKALEDKIAAADKAADDAVAALKDYVKAEDYNRLAASVFEATTKLSTIDFEHNNMIKQALTAELQAYVKAEDYDALAKSVAGLFDTLSLIDKNHAEYIKTVLADYVGTSTFDLLATRVQTLETSMDEIADHVKQIENDYGTKLDGLFGMITQLATDTQNMGKEIQGALVNYATKVEVEALDGRLDKLEEVVRAILDAFYTKEEVENFDSLGDDLLNLPAETITVMIKDKMSLKEWNETTYVVIDTIRGIQELISTIYNAQTGVYSKDNMDKINTILADAGLNIQIFENYVKANKADTQKLLEYTILRVATLAELEVLTKAITDANNVPTFQEELEMLYAGTHPEFEGIGLYTIGHEHEHVDANDVATRVQAVTYADLADFLAFTDAYDALVAEYKEDGVLATGYYTMYDRDTNYMYVWTHPTTGKKIVSWNDEATGYTTIEKDADNNDVTITWKYDRVTLIHGSEGAEWKTTNDAGIYKLANHRANYVLDNGNSYGFTWGTAYNFGRYVLDGHYGNESIPAPSNNCPEQWYATTQYWALADQLNTCWSLINNANTRFTRFLNSTVKANSVMPDESDNSYLDALTAYMCELLDGAPQGYPYYLLEYVEPVMTRAINRNTCENKDHTAAALGEITKLKLYQDMLAKVWDELFVLYQGYAKQLVNTMLADYISVTWNFTYADAVKTGALVPSNQYLNGEIANGLDYGKYTAGFLAAFLDGSNTFAGWKSANDVLVIPQGENFANLTALFGTNNGAAHDAEGNPIMADPVATIEANSLALRMYLTASVTAVTRAINETKLDDAKAQYGSDATPKAVFVDLLKTARDNLDEVYARYLLEDYKKVLINDLYVTAIPVADLYSGAGDTDLIEAMQLYMTGYSTATNMNAEDAANTLFDKVLFSYNEDDTANYGALADGELMSQMDAIAFDIESGIDGTVTALKPLGTTAMANAVVVVNGIKADLKDMAIMVNFVSYLDVAADNLQYAYYDYLVIDRISTAMVNELSSIRNAGDAMITITKYQAERGTIEFSKYSDKYAELLTQIASADQNAHMEDLDIPNFATAKNDILSSDLGKGGYAYPENIFRPVDALTGRYNTYNYVGSIVVNFDRTVNMNAQYVADYDDNGNPIKKPLYEN